MKHGPNKNTLQKNLYNPGNGDMIIKTQNIINVNIITWIIHHIIMF